MQASKRFTENAAALLRKEIAGAGDNEVFALGYCDGKGLVESIRVMARGNEGSVLALRKFFEAEGPGASFEDAAPEDADNSGAPSEGTQSSGADGPGVSRPPDVFIHNHPSGFLTPSDADMSVSARAAETGVGSYIVDNDVAHVYVVAEPVGRKKRRLLDPAKLCAVLDEDGPLAGILPSYEKREAQLELVGLVAEAFNGDKIAAAEAGTGVGKSFAYLLPAIEDALVNRERVILSTATINLQQQLFEKDIPLAARVLGKKVKAVLMKGRGNYLCRRRLAEALLEPPLDDAEFDELRAIAAWAETTKTGGRSELAFSPAEGLWGRVYSEGDACLGMRCPERERCFFLALRRECAEARLIVVNHHLLFADLAARWEGAGYESAVVLPPYTRVIIDEAHNIESAATSFFSREWSRVGLARALGRLYRKRRGRESGLLIRLAAQTGQAAPSAGKAAAAEAGSALPAKLVKAAAALREWAEKADAAGLDLCGEEGTCRLAPGVSPGRAVKEVLFPALAELRRSITAFTGQVRALLETAEANASGGAKAPDGGEDPLIWEIKSVIRRFEPAAAVCASFLDYEENLDDVHWMEKQSGRDPWVRFSATPLDIAPYLRDALFDANKTVVCLSATLTVAGPEGRPSFAYWAARSGAALAGRETASGIFPSPFPYAAHVLLAVPTDAPPPESPAYQDFVNRAVAGLTSSSGGSALVLFTSYQSLRAAFQYAAPRLEEEGIRCLRQGDDDRSRLLAAFLEDRSSVLFGTDSFWEGVDAPGDTLRLVIICRLPFRAPREPVFEARRELVERTGGSAFMELSLPDAVMKFKQGFGRLMRRSSDHGVVAVLDNRLLSKFYGKVFTASLPETRTSFKELDGVLRDMDAFLFG